MDAADSIMLIAGMDIPAIKNTKLCLEVLYSLEHSQKIKLILNKFNKKMGIPRKDIESSLGMKASYIIPEEEQITPSLNKGIPFIEAHPRSTAAQEIKRIAKDLLGTSLVNTVPEEVKTKNSSLPRVLGLGT
jgi:pilus assembly protein CpaE